MRNANRGIHKADHPHLSPLPSKGEKEGRGARRWRNCKNGRSIARKVRAAQRRVRICSLLINSGTLISELSNLLRTGRACHADSSRHSDASAEAERRRVAVDGIYDRTQMEEVYRQWQDVPQNRWKIDALKDIIARAGLVGKNSTPYTPAGRHDFMHNKVLVIDDTVVTGSYNLSRSAQFNAENILFIESAPLAEAYSVYIDHLIQKYGPPATP